ncbi:LacI family DNA-binding transcriptional regulator [uncultured Draconibacterium sp.]|uniref:LacI family DNA-binding transcriptional regulator n=1 Tax=uncultured Draconibacterium sp. TaxID=1573823 RepID=UPI0025D7ED1C|nr:LacI family DNA-binding transcriptional regulator [uncultured Draconibacterium sp.]
MASMEDVAKRAGVSIATVSRVLNNNGKVNDATRARILKAIKELKYQPSRVAKRLRSKSVSGNLIGVLIPDIQNPFYVDVLEGIEEVAYNNNYALIMCNFSQDEKKEKLYLEILQSEGIDGIIAAPASEDDIQLKRMVKDGLPVVCVDRGLSNTDVDVVLVNNEDSAFNAVDFLAKQGYKRIAIISGLTTIPSTTYRDKGYVKALEHNGLPVLDELIKHGDSKLPSGVQLCEELLNLPEPPDAIFTGNNLITLGALETIHKRKLTIPDDVAIVGFDDMYWASSLNPPLTAVRQPAREIGKRAGELLIQRINEPERSSIQMILNAELMKRSSA